MTEKRLQYNFFAPSSYNYCTYTYFNFVTLDSKILIFNIMKENKTYLFDHLHDSLPVIISLMHLLLASLHLLCVRFARLKLFEFVFELVQLFFASGLKKYFFCKSHKFSLLGMEWNCTFMVQKYDKLLDTSYSLVECLTCKLMYLRLCM